MKCLICNKEFKRLSNHIFKVHKISLDDYCFRFLQKKGECLYCGKPTKLISLELGYRNFCSHECSNRSTETKEKIKQTVINNYGVDNPSKSLEIKEKMKKTFIEHYGVDNPKKNELVNNKFKQTCLERYGVDNPNKTEDTRNKISETCIKRYGEKAPCMSPIIKDKAKNTFKQVIFDRIIHSSRLKSVCIPNFDVEEYNCVKDKYSWICTQCNNLFIDHLDDGHIPRCPICNPIEKDVSLFEKEISNFCKQYYPNLLENDRTILNNNYELDIYIPEINLAIECDGLYWHSELSGKSKDYHINKTNQCLKKGIQLIHIFEDEWLNKQDIVKSILLAKMGKIENKIYARKCEVREVLLRESDNFLLENHLQGPINGKSIGLYYNNELVSLITYGKPRFNKKYDVEIFRFCNKKNLYVIGGLSKLTKNIGSNNIITYCDLKFSNGGGYIKSGFIKMHQTDPNYYYLKNNQRYNRMMFQKHKLVKILNVFDSNLTEWENMQLNGYDRIWDCGNLVFEYN